MDNTLPSSTMRAIASLVVLFVLATTFLALRIYVRVSALRSWRLGTDDYLILSAWVSPLHMHDISSGRASNRDNVKHSMGVKQDIICLHAHALDDGEASMDAVVHHLLHEPLHRAVAPIISQPMQPWRTGAMLATGSVGSVCDICQW
ncbi:hypothetical protein CCUS01_00074 [Colletotrichum cuscutae]|uniref:Integral membrane protein n=1 Tax=Colletotrichum cuscutae TaxID=1209917 RepID=A0AAJ0DQJ7_9PEZI|nr:hypothetical protein CCUS01_00074 [Colletotrichum cuscutae]